MGHSLNAKGSSKGMIKNRSGVKEYYQINTCAYAYKKPATGDNLEDNVDIELKHGPKEIS